MTNTYTITTDDALVAVALIKLLDGIKRNSLNSQCLSELRFFLEFLLDCEFSATDEEIKSFSIRLAELSYILDPFDIPQEPPQ